MYRTRIQSHSYTLHHLWKSQIGLDLMLYTYTKRWFNFVISYQTTNFSGCVSNLEIKFPSLES